MLDRNFWISITSFRYSNYIIKSVSIQFSCKWPLNVYPKQVSSALVHCREMSLIYRTRFKILAFSVLAGPFSPYGSQCWCAAWGGGSLPCDDVQLQSSYSQTHIASYERDQEHLQHICCRAGVCTKFSHLLPKIVIYSCYSVHF